MTKEEAIKYLQQIYPNGCHCWLDKQRIEAIGMAIKALQEEPTGNTLGSTHAEFRTAVESLGISQEEHDRIVDECIYGKEPELVDADDLPKEEPVSEELEQAVDNYLANYFGGEKEKQDRPFLKKMAIHFAKWQKEQMMANAVDGAFIRRNRYTKKNVLNGLDTTCDAIQRFKDKDKIKVLFIKED